MIQDLFFALDLFVWFDGMYYGCIGKDLEYSKTYTPKKKTWNWIGEWSLKPHFRVPFVIFQGSRLFLSGLETPLFGHRANTAGWDIC